MLAPGDVQKLELLREGGTTGAFLFKGRAEIEAWLGAPHVTNTALPVKTALVGDWSTVELLTRGGTRVDVDTAGTLFDTNSAKLRVEQRVGLKIGRPGAIVKVGTAA